MAVLRNTLDADENTTLYEWLCFWFKTYKQHKIKNTTYDDYSTTIERHIAPKIGSIPLMELTGDILQEFFNEEKASGNLVTGEAMSNKSIKNMKNVLNAALAKAVDFDILPKNPMNTVEILPVEKKEMIVFTIEEEEKFTNWLLERKFSGTYDFALFIALRFGLRSGEILALTYGSFDFDAMVLRVRNRVCRVKNRNSEGGGKTFLELSSPKTRESMRDIPFTEKFAEIAKAYFKTRGAKSNIKSNYIFSSKSGDFSDPSTLNKYFHTKLEECGIKKKMRLHDLRHTFATRAIEHNVDIKSLSVILGHTSVQFTLDRYAHVLGDQKRATMETLLSDL